MQLDDRTTYLSTTLAAIEQSWPHVLPELQEMIDDLTQKLIGAENEQTRGAIKVLLRVKDLPATLANELKHITPDE